MKNPSRTSNPDGPVPARPAVQLELFRLLQLSRGEAPETAPPGRTPWPPHRVPHAQDRGTPLPRPGTHPWPPRHPSQPFSGFRPVHPTDLKRAPDERSNVPDRGPTSPTGWLERFPSKGPRPDDPPGPDRGVPAVCFSRPRSPPESVGNYIPEGSALASGKTRPRKRAGPRPPTQPFPPVARPLQNQRGPPLKRPPRPRGQRSHRPVALPTRCSTRPKAGRPRWLFRKPWGPRRLCPRRP